MHPKRQSKLLIALLTLLALTLFVGCSDSTSDSYEPTQSKTTKSAELFPVSHNPERLAAISPETCVECHADEVAQWRASHHAKANRPVSMEQDARAFTPVRQIENP